MDSGNKNIRPEKLIAMTVNNLMAAINDPNTPKRDRANYKNGAILLMTELLRINQPIPKDLAAFCADYIPTLVKTDRRGAKPRHDSNEGFKLYRNLTENKGMSHSEAIKQVIKFYDDQGVILDPTTISKSIEQDKKLLALVMMANDLEK